MSKYTKNLNPLPYENGFKDKPEKTTISASILNNWFSVLGRLEDWLYQHDILDILPNKVPAGEPSTQLNNLYVDGTIYTVSGGGGDLDDLTNVDISSPQEGDALVYDSTNQEWVNGTVSSVDDLDDLSNVDIVNVVNGQALCYNGVTSKWENQTVPGGGSANIWTGTQAEYEAQASQIADDTVVLITDDEEHTQAFDVYSTNEQVIGTWIDGSTIYRKVIDFGALPNTTTKQVAHGITGLDKVISIVGAAHDPTNDYYNPLPSANPGDARYDIGVNVTSTNVIITTVVDMSSYTSSYVIIRYTKASS